MREQRTILHVEDDPALVGMVRMAFNSFGFHGDFVRAGTVAEAVALLDDRRRREAPLDLILEDMNLPDGSGLDVLRKVKDSPTWRMTPVIILSGEATPSLIDEAYALGANCYLPKQGAGKSALGSIKALYECWVDGALLPQTIFPDPVQTALGRAVRLRARTARFYRDLAHSSSADSEQERFWLERSLTEGNKSNLIAFFQGQLSEKNVPAGVAEQAIAIQERVEQTLNRIEPHLQMRSSPRTAEICHWILDLATVWDEKAVAEVFGALFSNNPSVTQALKIQSAGQLRAVAEYVLTQSQEPELRRRAETLVAFSYRMEVSDKAGSQR